MSEENNPENLLICYTDGSAQPNPGYSGFGLFGYILKPSKKPRNINYPAKANYKFTSEGIVNQTTEDFTDELKEENYECLGVVEYIGSTYSDSATNNQGEVNGILTALKYALILEDIKELLIISDSRYALDGYEKYLRHWIKNGYRNKQGASIRNKELWVEMAELKSEIKDKGITVTTRWVKGHEDDVGNINADLYALVGTNHARNQLTDGVDEHDFDYSCFNGFTPITDFRKELDDKSFILDYKRSLFYTGNPNDKIILLNSTVKDKSKPEDFLGRRNLNNVYALAYNNIPFKITKLRRSFSGIKRSYNKNAFINLDTLKKDKIIVRLTNRIGFDSLVAKVVNDRIEEFVFFDRSGVLVTEVDLKFTHINEAYTIYGMLEYTLIKIPILKEKGLLIDVTEDFYDEKGKSVIKYADKSVDYSDRFKERGVALTSSIFLHYGMDTPSSTVLKELEGRNNKVYLFPDIVRNPNLITLICILEYTDDYGETSYILQTNLLDKYLVKNGGVYSEDF